MATTHDKPSPGRNADPCGPIRSGIDPRQDRFRENRDNPPSEVHRKRGSPSARRHARPARRRHSTSSPHPDSLHRYTPCERHCAARGCKHAQTLGSIRAAGGHDITIGDADAVPSCRPTSRRARANTASWSTPAARTRPYRIQHRRRPSRPPAPNTTPRCPTEPAAYIPNSASSPRYSPAPTVDASWIGLDARYRRRHQRAHPVRQLRARRRHRHRITTLNRQLHSRANFDLPRRRILNPV